MNNTGQICGLEVKSSLIDSLFDSFLPKELDLLLKVSNNQLPNIGTIYEETSLLESINDEEFF